MNLRITTQTQVSRALDNLRRQTDQLADLQQQAQTGLRLNKPSDNPLDVVIVLESKAQDSRLGAYLSNIHDATDTLNESVSTLTDLGNVFTRARQIALEGVNGTTSGSNFDALASEVDRLLERVIAGSNTTLNGRTLFGGTATGKPAFAVTATDAQGKPLAVAYQGAAERASAPIGAGETVDTSYTGSEIFQTAGADAFQSLMDLRDDLRKAAAGNANSAALSQDVADVEKAQNAILGTVGEMSAHLENLAALDSRLQDVQVQTKTRVGDLESADLADVVLNLRTQENLYSATLATSARIFDQNLLDFLH